MRNEDEEKTLKEICTERANFTIGALAFSVFVIWIIIDFTIGFSWIFNLIGLAIILVMLFFRPFYDLIELSYEIMEEEKDDYK